MTDRERILAMVEDGKLSQQEADRLIAVLDDIDDVDHSMRQVDEEAQATNRPRAAPDPDGGRQGESPAGTTGEAERAGPVDYPGDLRWLRINMLMGDLDIRADAGLEEPVVESGSGDHRLERDGDHYTLSQFAGREQEGLLDRLIGGLRRSELKLKVPSDFGVHLDVKAGDVKVEEVAFLRGHLLAGDLNARARGVDLTMSAGDLDLELTLAGGQHRLGVSAGDVRVALLDGSSVRVDGRLSIGEASLPDGFDRHSGGIGERFSGVVGGGEGELDIKLSAGDLKVSAPR